MSSFDNKSFSDESFPEQNWFITYVIIPVENGIKYGVTILSRIATKLQIVVKS